MQVVPAHSKIGPSKSHRWIHCPGSVAASEGCPDKCSDAASLGTAAHLLGELTIKAGYRNPKLWPECPDEVEGKEGKMYPVDNDMLDAVEVYTEYVFKNWHGGDVHTEARFHLGNIHPDLFGTNDCMIAIPMESLHVIDYKHGSGQFVEIVEDENGDLDYEGIGGELTCLEAPLELVNPQLLIYALGGLNSIIDPVREVKLSIVQPRCEAEYKIRSVLLQARDIRNWGEEVLKPAAEKCFAENPEYKIGSWCRFCPAIACPAKLEKAFGLVKANPLEQKTITFPLPNQMTPEQLLAINEFADAFKGWADDVKAFIRHQLETGRMTSKQLGLKLVQGNKAKIWKENYKQIILANGILEQEELYNDPKPKSPAQMDTLLKEEHGFSKEERDNLLKPAYTEEPGSPRLVALSARGEELKPSAAIAFQQFDNEKE
jgi:hypothetical protein